MKSTNFSFSFETVTKENNAKLITNLDIKKSVQSMDILTKLVNQLVLKFYCFQSS